MNMYWESESLRKSRNVVIEKLINLESLISAIICQYYLKRVTTKFYFGVLYNENFSLGLKRGILEKIPQIDQRMIHKLNRLMKIRNRFAHCGPQVFWGTTLPTEGEKPVIPDPENWRASLDFEALYTEFLAEEPEVTKYLFEFFRTLGGVAEKA